MSDSKPVPDVHVPGNRSALLEERFRGEFTQQEKLKEISRELAMRERVFPMMMRTGKLTQDEADRRIAILKEIAKDYGGHGQ